MAVADHPELSRPGCVQAPLLDVRDLHTSFFTDEGEVPAVDGVSLRIPRGRTVALVGESGCGKSVTALSIMRLIAAPHGRIVGGQVLLDLGESSPAGSQPSVSGDEPCTAAAVGNPTASDGTSAMVSDAAAPAANQADLLTLSERRMRDIRGNRIAMIFQEPTTSLNPVFSLGEQIAEAIELHQPLRGKAAWAAAVEVLHRVGIAAPERRAHDYPHQLSGGMCQRVMIAMALSCQPSLLIADEPTTALDTTVQLQILELLRSLQAESGMSILMITHDLGVVARLADDVYVMYAGRIVEHGRADALLSDPFHPYTQGLLACVPRLSDRGERLAVIPGRVPDPRDAPAGCRFHPRCQRTVDAARRLGREAVAIESELSAPALKSCVEPDPDDPSAAIALRELDPGRFVACSEVAEHASRTPCGD